MSLRRALGHTALYAIGDGLARSLHLLILPLVTRGLGVGEFGVLSLVLMIGMFLTPMLMVPAAGLIRDLVERRELRDRQRAFGTAVASIVVGAVAAMVVATLGQDWLADALLGDRTRGTLIVLGTAYACLDALTAIALVPYRASERPVPLVRVTVLRLVTLLIAIVVATRHFAPTVEGVLYAYVCAVGVAGLIGWGEARKLLGAKPHWDELRGQWAFGQYLIVANVGNWILLVGDRLFLQAYAGAEGVGAYTLAFRVAQGLLLFTTAFRFATYPMIFRLGSAAQSPDADVPQADVPRDILADGANALRRLPEGYVFGAGPALVLIAGGAYWWVRLLAPESFALAIGVVPALAMAFYLDGLAGSLRQTLFLGGRTGLQGWLYALGVMVGLWGWGLVIPLYGAVGAAWATCGAYLVMRVASVWMAQRVRPLDYAWGRLSALTSGAFALGFGLHVASVKTHGSAWVLALTVALATAWGAVPLALGWVRIPRRTSA